MKTFFNIALSLLVFLFFVALLVFGVAAILAGSFKYLVFAALCVPAIFGAAFLNCSISK